MRKKPYSKGYDPQKRRRQYETNWHEERAYQKEKMSRVKARLFDILGRKCSNPKCLVLGGCTDVRCLQFDHINGGGTKEIREMGNSQMYRYYADHPEEAKKRIQILCANCNWIKRHENKENWSYEVREKAKARVNNRNLFEFMPEEAEPKVKGQRRPA